MNGLNRPDVIERVGRRGLICAYSLSVNIKPLVISRGEDFHWAAAKIAHASRRLSLCSRTFCVDRVDLASTVDRRPSTVECRRRRRDGGCVDGWLAGGTGGEAVEAGGRWCAAAAAERAGGAGAGKGVERRWWVPPPFLGWERERVRFVVSPAR